MPLTAESSATFEDRGRLGQALMSALRYFTSAAMGLCVDWAVFWIAFGVLRYLGASEGALLTAAAQGLARTTGAVMSYQMMRRIAFRDATGEARDMVPRFVVAAAASWTLSISLVTGLTALLPLLAALTFTPASAWPILHAVLVAKVLSDGCTFVVNWFVMRFWVFRA